MARILAISLLLGTQVGAGGYYTGHYNGQYYINSMDRHFTSFRYGTFPELVFMGIQFCLDQIERKYSYDDDGKIPPGVEKNRNGYYPRYKTWGYPLRRESQLPRDPRNTWPRVLCPWLYPLRSYTSEDFDILVDMPAQITASPPWNGIPPFSDIAAPKASCHDQASRIGWEIFNRDRTSRYVEPQRTIERICTAEVLAAEARYNEALLNFNRKQYQLENFHLLAEAVETRVSENDQLLTKWVGLAKADGVLDLRRLRLGDAGLRSDLIAAKASTFAILHTATYDYGNDLLSAVTNLISPLLHQALAITRLQNHLDKLGIAPRQRSANIDWGNIGTRILSWLESSALAADGTVLVYRPSQGLNFDIRNIGVANISNIYAQARANEAMREKVRDDLRQGYTDRTAQFKVVWGKSVQEYYSQNSYNFVALNQRLASNISQAMDVRKAIEILDSSGELPEDAQTIKDFYEFKSPPSENRKKLEGIYGKLARATPITGSGKTAQGIGLHAIQEADRSFSGGDMEGGHTFLSIASVMADVALDIVPIVGPTKQLFEGISGRSILTGRHLSSWERTFSFIGAATGGFVSWKLLEPAVTKLTLALARSAEELTKANKVLSSSRGILDAAMGVLGNSDSKLKNFFSILSDETGSVGPDLASGIRKIKRPRIWTEGKHRDAVRNAYQHWKDHKGDFPQLNNAFEYVEHGHEFIENPPVGTLTKVRPNGDTLFFHPESNTFAIKDASGAPRTIFKPKAGMSYWEKQ